MRFIQVVCVIGLFFGAFSVAHAGLITSQSQLSLLLGAGETMENFEGNGLLSFGQKWSSAPLNSTSLFAGYGPGLVQAGVTYSANTLYWNDNGYFGLNTRTLGDSALGNPLTILYTQPATAFGFDMQGYAGYVMNGVIDVYDLANNLLASTSVNGGFFGWESAGGISRVTVASSSGYIMIDNHGYGVTSNSNSVFEPATLALMGVGLAGVSLRRKVAV